MAPLTPLALSLFPDRFQCFAISLQQLGVHSIRLSLLMHQIAHILFTPMCVFICNARPGFSQKSGVRVSILHLQFPRKLSTVYFYNESAIGSYLTGWSEWGIGNGSGSLRPHETPATSSYSLTDFVMSQRVHPCHALSVARHLSLKSLKSLTSAFPKFLVRGSKTLGHRKIIYLEERCCTAYLP